eukprot:scaffold9116_cov148-Skeletonema_menzelii.AAC.6
MDASESSVAVDTAAAVDNNKDSASDDAVVDDASAAKNRKAQDDGKIVLDTIFEKSTSSSSKTIIDEENVQKAISFLSNKEIRDVSPSEKRGYLKTKGINQHEIDTALDRLATAPSAGTERTRGAGSIRDDQGQSSYQHRQQYQQQHQNAYGGPPPSPGPLNQNHYNNMQSSPHANMSNYFAPPNNMGNIRPEGGGESASFSFSTLAGGFCMSTFCLAAVRWLNGGDFVLFPPPVAGGRYIKPDANEIQTEEDDGETTADHPDETSFNSQGSGDPDINMILNGIANHENDVHGNNNQEQTSFEDLVMEVKALSTTINSFREEQDRANRVATAQLGKVVTDDAMNSLRQQKPPVLQKKGDVDAIDKKDVSRITSLITEMVEELSQVKVHLDDVAAVDERDHESDGNTKADQSVLSSKIDIAIGKGREILALIKSPEEQSNDKIESQQAPSAEHGNEDEDEAGKQDEKNKPKPDQTPTANENPGENSDVNQDSIDIEEALQTLSQKNESGELKIGAQMLYLYCKNLSKNPTVPRYRKIYTNNNSFSSKVGNLIGVKDFLSALGFVERTNFFEWSDTSPDTKSRQLDFALVALEQLQKGRVEDTEIVRSDTSDEKSEITK